MSNLLSNALEHTFSGEIAVELRHRTYHAELIVRDTGIGIAEGSGIRLSVVQEPGRCPQVRASPLYRDDGTIRGHVGMNTGSTGPGSTIMLVMRGRRNPEADRECGPGER